MAIFKKLSIGDTVASSGTRVFKKLTTEEVTPEEPSLPIWNGTDLAGTTWEIPAGWAAEAEYGQFDVSGYTNRPASITSTVVHRLFIGYAVNSLSGPPFALANSFCWLHGQYPETTPLYGGISDTTIVRCFMFTGGTDATNPRLISWLLENGRLTSHRFNIKGAWLFNETITQLPEDYSKGADGESFHISFKCGESYCQGLYGGSVSEESHLWFVYWLPSTVYNFDTEMWEEDSLRSVIFTEDSVTNDAGKNVTEIFYKWLTTNATIHYNSQ